MPPRTLKPPSGIPTVENATHPFLPVSSDPPPDPKSRWSRFWSPQPRPGSDLISARPPYGGGKLIRLVVAASLGVLAMLTLGGGLVVLLLWREERSRGVLSAQIDRAWDLVDTLRQVELVVALAAVVVATAWAALTTINVRRATGQRLNPAVAALSIPIAIAAVWAIGDRIVAPADDWPAATGGIVLQAVALAIPVIALERVAQASEGRRRPFRATYVAAVAYVAHLQGLGALTTIEATVDRDRWARLAAYLIMASLMQVLGAIAANEACRSVEDASAHRYTMRRAFGESVLLQVQR